jgi:hypothetical protein
MDASELARTMLEWEKVQREADRLKALIQDAVLDLKATQTVGAVRATYSKGRKTYDYQGAIEAAEESGDLDWEDLEPFEEVKLDYRRACNTLSLDVSCKQGKPSVSLKLLS